MKKTTLSNPSLPSTGPFPALCHPPLTVICRFAAGALPNCATCPAPQCQDGQASPPFAYSHGQASPSLLKPQKKAFRGRFFTPPRAFPGHPRFEPILLSLRVLSGVFSLPKSSKKLEFFEPSFFFQGGERPSFRQSPFAVTRLQQKRPKFIYPRSRGDNCCGSCYHLGRIGEVSRAGMTRGTRVELMRKLSSRQHDVKGGQER